jgi:hypothetical protein
VSALSFAAALADFDAAARQCDAAIKGAAESVNSYYREHRARLGRMVLEYRRRTGRQAPGSARTKRLRKKRDSRLWESRP